MKKEYNKGSRPALDAARKQQYIVSTRLDSEHYLRLRDLVRESGCQPAEIIWQLIARG